MDITKNYFEVFGLVASYTIDMDDLAVRYRELQREIHPDRFADRGDREQRMAVQFAAYVNEGLDTLKSPVKRAEYLLQLQGVEADPQNKTTNDGAFLMQQMQLREELSEVRDQADPEAALDTLSDHTGELLQQLQGEFQSSFEAEDFSAAAAVVDKLHFITKLEHEIEQLEAQLLDY